MTGIEHIQNSFETIKSQRRAALILYYTLGFPDSKTSLDVIRAAAEAGADMIELGVPFSDPLADGPTIQYSTQAALEGGISVKRCLDLTCDLRAGGLTKPMLLMGYTNPILAYGPERFVSDARQVGADGLILPDLPLEEAEFLSRICRDHGMALVFLAFPASPQDRLARLAEATSGFLYLASITGVTGARNNLPPDLSDFIMRTKPVARTPLAVGIGISTPAQAAAVGKLVDGVIIGSALINAVRSALDSGLSPVDAVNKFVSAIRAEIG